MKRDQRDVQQLRARQPAEPDQQTDDQAEQDRARRVGERDQHALPEQRRVAQQEGEVPLVDTCARRAVWPSEAQRRGDLSRVTPNLRQPVQQPFADLRRCRG